MLVANIPGESSLGYSLEREKPKPCNADTFDSWLKQMEKHAYGTR